MRIIYLTSKDGGFFERLLKQERLRKDLDVFVLSNKRNKELEMRFGNKLRYFEGESGLDEMIEIIKPGMIFTSGFMRILSKEFVGKNDGIVNLHPGLRKGLNPTEQAIENRDRFTGNIVHFIDEGLDSGEIIAKSEIRIFPGETKESINQRLFENAIPIVLDVINNWEKLK
jgi:folate-dependent phosphoribosylglycinamide formyltransferase PurN